MILKTIKDRIGLFLAKILIKIGMIRFKKRKIILPYKFYTYLWNKGHDWKSKIEAKYYKCSFAPFKEISYRGRELTDIIEKEKLGPIFKTKISEN